MNSHQFTISPPTISSPSIISSLSSPSSLHFGEFFCCQFFEGFLDLFFRLFKARRKFFCVNNLFLLILLQILVDSRFQLFVRGGFKKNLVLFGNLPTTIPHKPLQPPNPLFGTPLLKQARKLQDAQAEKLTSLQANKLTS